MSPETIFRIHLGLGYVAWLLCFGVYGLPWLRSMDRLEAHRVIATLHSFRFFGLVFLLPGVVGPLPGSFTTFAAYGDFATGVLAMLALLTVRVRPLFWLFVPIVYVPLLMITHVVALSWLLRSRPAPARVATQ
jgi:hypothetical protein